MSFGWGWRPYVSVAERREQARRKMGVLKKKGIDVQPVEIEGRKIARTFWGSPGAIIWSRLAIIPISTAAQAPLIAQWLGLPLRISPLR